MGSPSVTPNDSPLATPGTPNRFARAFSAFLSPFTGGPPSRPSTPRPLTPLGDRLRTVSDTGEKNRRLSRMNWNGWRSVVSLNTFEERSSGGEEFLGSGSIQQQLSKHQPDLTVTLTNAGQSTLAVEKPTLRRKLSFRRTNTKNAEKLDIPPKPSKLDVQERTVAISPPRPLRKSPSITISPPSTASSASHRVPPLPPRIELSDFGFVRDGPDTPPPLPAETPEALTTPPPPPRIELSFVDTALQVEFGLGNVHDEEHLKETRALRRRSVTIC